MAQENGNQYLTPEHLLYALVDQDGGPHRLPARAAWAWTATPCSASWTPRSPSCRSVSGGSGEVYASPETEQDPALRREGGGEAGATSYVSVEHLMLGMFADGQRRPCKRILSDHGITRDGLQPRSSTKVKTGPVTSDNPEEHL